MSDLAWVMRKFISFLNESALSTLNADRYLLRTAPKRKKVLPCFTALEAEAILAAVDTTTSLGKRDFAILKLAIETGLRGADILSLRLVDIDWRKCEISVIQSKTDEPIQLPLLADVGNAVADYILHARPASDSPHVFLRTVNPYIRLGITGNGKNIISRYLEKAGVQHEAWDGKTFHAFRRTAGTRYVEAEVPLMSVAELLGHKHIDSAKRYISHNDEKMRACCLDISEFETGKEGLV
jgi:integrase